MSLSRFLNAQEGVDPLAFSEYRTAYSELRHGKKETHWMWYIFPQGTWARGTSERSRYFGIKNKAEAREYLLHPILGHRYLDCVNVVESWVKHTSKTYADIFGPDALKYHASVRLFLPN